MTIPSYNAQYIAMVIVWNSFKGITEKKEEARLWLRDNSAIILCNFGDIDYKIVMDGC